MRGGGWADVGVGFPRPRRSDGRKKTAHAEEQDRPDVLKRRREWFAAQPELDPERLVFIDETWASTYKARWPAPIEWSGFNVGA